MAEDDIDWRTDEEKLRDEAREVVKTPPETIPDAADLPDDVKSDPIEDEGEGS
jgi:hypothetical protein